MKMKYLLVVFCLLSSLSVLAQRRRVQQSDAPQKKEVAPTTVSADSSQNPDTSRAKFEDIIPETADNFCNVLMPLLHDAASDFERIRGKVIETVSNGTRYTSMGGVPGAITSCLIHSHPNWQYEGIMFQGSVKEDMQVVYDKYKNLLDNCLSAKGYVASRIKGKSSRLDGYPDYKYAPVADDGDKPTSNLKKGEKPAGHPYVTLNVEYTSEADIFVVTINVWSN